MLWNLNFSSDKNNIMVDEQVPPNSIWFTSRPYIVLTMYTANIRIACVFEKEYPIPKSNELQEKSHLSPDFLLWEILC